MAKSWPHVYYYYCSLLDPAQLKSTRGTTVPCYEAQPGNIFVQLALACLCLDVRLPGGPVLTKDVPCARYRYCLRTEPWARDLASTTMDTTGSRYNRNVLLLSYQETKHLIDLKFAEAKNGALALKFKVYQQTLYLQHRSSTTIRCRDLQSDQVAMLIRSTWGSKQSDGYMTCTSTRQYKLQLPLFAPD